MTEPYFDWTLVQFWSDFKVDQNDVTYHVNEPLKSQRIVQTSVTMIYVPV